MNKEDRQLPTRWVLRFWLQRLRAKRDAKRGTDAVQKRLFSMFTMADAYVHRRCAAFLDEKHALFVEAANLPEYEPEIKHMTPEEAKTQSIVQRKAAAAAEAAAVQAELHALERVRTTQEDLEMYVKELSEDIEFFMGEATASAQTYLSRIADLLELQAIENPFETYEFQPRQYNIVIGGKRDNEKSGRNTQ